VSPDKKAGYGPLTEALQHGTYRAIAAATSDPWRQVHWFKLPAALFDLLTIAAALSLLKARGQPLAQIVVYAWNPLTIMEFWATGHNDAVPVFFVTAALAAAVSGRWTLSWTALACGAAAKFWPALLAPIFVREMNRRGERLRWQWVGGALIALAVSLPYAADLRENAAFMTGFVGGWRNNDSLHGLILAVVGDPYVAKRVAFGLVALAVLAATFSKWRLESKCLAVLITLLAVSSNCHPWYLTWLLPFLVMVPFVPALLWMGLMPIAYGVLIDWHFLREWNGVTPLRWAIHGPFFAAVLIHLLWSNRLRRPKV
jgi:hypothetical protein